MSISNLQKAFTYYVYCQQNDEIVRHRFWHDIATYWSNTEGNEDLTDESVRKRFSRRYHKLKRANFSDDVMDEIILELAKDDRTYLDDDDVLEEFEETCRDENYEDWNNNKIETDWDLENNTVSVKSNRIRSLDELIDIAEIDLNVFEIERHLINSWEVTSWKSGKAEVRTNWQVKAWLRNKFFNKVDPIWVDSYFEKVGVHLPKINIPKINNSGTPLVCTLADLHAGGFTENMKLVPDYNLEVLEVKLMRIAKYIKEAKRPTHLKILGDLIESFTGKNHKDTWKQIEMHGIKVMFVVADLLQKMIEEAEYIETIDMISGNHDRITSANDDDVEGQVAYGVAELLRRNLPNHIKIDFDPLVLSQSHGGVNYILLHGHLPISKKNPARLVLDYGDQNKYNVILTAHKHSELIKLNTTKMRLHQVPSLVPANNFAQNLGEHAPTGYVIFEENEFKSVDAKSYAV